MSLRTKFFLLSGGIVTGVMLVVSLFVHLRLGEAADADAEGDLTRTVAIITRLEDERRAGGIQTARLLADLVPRLSAASGVQSVGPALEVPAHPESSFSVAADAAGGIIGLSGHAPTDDLRRALDGDLRRAAAREGAAGGFWLLDGTLYEVAIAAGSAAPDVLVARGERIDEADVDRLKRLTGAEVVIVADGTVVGSSLPVDPTRELAELAARLRPGLISRVRIAGAAYHAHLAVLPLAFGGREVRRLVLHSPRVASSSLAEDLRTDLPVIGMSGLVLALAAAWLGARELTSPLRRSAEAMSEMARSRRFDGGLDRVGRSPEVRLFHDAFRSLIDTLARAEGERAGSYAEAVAAVVVAIEPRDNETTGHSFRVARYAVALGERMDLPPEELQNLEWGALLHDIGKLAVPDAVLLKGGPLTEEEWHIMRQHPAWGMEILGTVRFLEPALEIVGNHQERWDGAGYPWGLAGEEIPRTARIFAVVDAYDAITSDRPYRRARSHREAVAELRRVAGTQLDPRAVEAFVSIPAEELRRLRDGVPPGSEHPAPPFPARFGGI